MKNSMISLTWTDRPVSNSLALHCKIVPKTFIVSESSHCFLNQFRVRKYAKFGVFYAKIVQMTRLRLRRESRRLQKFLVTKREPFPSWVSLTIVYTCQDHVLESLKMAFFVVILDSKYSKMTPKFVKQKSHWLHSSIKFANPVIF